MEIKVNISELEDLSGRIRSIGNIIEDIYASYRTNNYEILCDMDAEYADEMKMEMEEISKQIDDCFFLIKKHENFVLNSSQEYADAETEIVKNASLIVNELYSGNTSSINFSGGSIYENETDTDNIISDLNFDYIPVFKLPAKVDFPSDLHLKDINLIVDGYNQSLLVNGFDKYIKLIIGFIISTAPSAFISAIGNISSILIGELNGFTGGNFVSGGADGEHFGGFNAMLGFVGSAMQINYNNTAFKSITEIMAWLAGSSIAIGAGSETITLFTLADDKTETEGEKKKKDENKKDGETTTEPTIDIIENDKTQSNKSDNDNENTVLENNNSYTDDTASKEYNNIMYGQNAIFGTNDEEHKDYKNNYVNNMAFKESYRNESDIYAKSSNRDIDENSNNVFSSDTQKNIYENKENGENVMFFNAEYPKSDTMDTSGKSGVISGTSFSSGSILGENGEKVISTGMGFSVSVVSSENAKNGHDNIIAHNVGEMRNSNEWAAYRGANSAYEKIISRNSSKMGKTGNSGFAVTGLGITGTGVAASTAVFVGGMASSTGAAASEVTKEIISGAMSFVIGMSDFDNLFDLVGKASRCNIGWLSEITNVLMV